VLWKYTKTFPNVKNIKTVTWMPQNDILGHPQLRLFMTHGGANSVYEAAYHGVPLLVTPLWGDQFGFAQKVRAVGMGSSIDIRFNTVITAENIVELINELIENQK
jgi:UDP:flavonoid glycosyltransferase YjiC (YdhE family)